MGGSGAGAECGSADGIRAANAAETGLVLPSAKIGTLIARIGGGGWFAVGTSSTFTAGSSGLLELMFNDRTCCYVDNSGSIEVTVAVSGP
jgi:hypothetical protein